MKILLLSAYDVDSHKRWRQTLVRAFQQYAWTVLCLPPRHFRWRIRGNPISWSLTHDAELRRHYDLVIATSMVDIATLRGLYPSLANARLLVYFHENQLAYPCSRQQHTSIDPAMVNIYAAMAADTVVFNSAYNRDSFFQGVAQLIDKLPDAIEPRLVSAMEAKSRVVPVPLEDELFAQPPAARGNVLTLAWNHRVEYDKGIELLLAILIELQSRCVDFRLMLLGRRFRQVPAAWRQIETEFSGHIVTNGFAETREHYWRCLRQAQVVLSTAEHEFQGLAVMEAVALGCSPVVPDRLSYPEVFPPAYRYSTPGEAVTLILSAEQRRACDLRGFTWTRWLKTYSELLVGKPE